MLWAEFKVGTEENALQSLKKLEELGRPRETIKMLKIKGLTGTPRDAWRVGRIYSNGVGVPKDYHKAFEYANRGAERGYACMIFFVWEIYKRFV